MANKVTAIPFGNYRFVIADAETGEILDDAQGYGYHTKQKAYAAWNYKNRDPKKDQEWKKKKAVITAWMKEHKSFVRLLDAEALELWTDERQSITAKYLKEMLQREGHTDLPFTPGDFLKVWKSRK